MNVVPKNVPENLPKFAIRAANTLVSAVVVLFLLAAGAYSVYALWDNAQVYAAVDDVQAELLSMKPESGRDNGASFGKLRAVNPDVCAWLSVDNTAIDYPVLQGEDNMTYINRDVYGDFALAGSIFLDASCDDTFHDAYSLLYGHHMENSKMFGDLDLFKDESFFNKNTTGTLILPDRTYQLEIFAYLLVPASENAIFQASRWKADIGGLLDFAGSNATHLHRDVWEQARQTPDTQILALSTCASEFTDARTILLAVMTPYAPETTIGG